MHNRAENSGTKCGEGLAWSCVKGECGWVLWPVTPPILILASLAQVSSVIHHLRADDRVSSPTANGQLLIHATFTDATEDSPIRIALLRITTGFVFRSTDTGNRCRDLNLVCTHKPPRWTLLQWSHGLSERRIERWEYSDKIRAQNRGR